MQHYGSHTHWIFQQYIYYIKNLYILCVPAVTNSKKIMKVINEQ